MRLAPGGQARMRGMVDQHSGFVGRVLRKEGVSSANLDDEVQRTFIVAASRLEQLQVGAERSFLRQVALYVASHARRRTARSREDAMGDPPELDDAAPSPEQLIDRKRMQELLDRVVDCLDEPARAVFILHASQDKSLTEIAAMVRVVRAAPPQPRLRRARRQLRGTPPRSGPRAREGTA